MPAVLLVYVWSAVFDGDDGPRLAVMTEIGNDPDDVQSMIRLMMYVNEFKIDVLIASAWYLNLVRSTSRSSPIAEG